MDIQRIHRDDLVLLDCISGSTAYGLNIASSDIDKRGVFRLHKYDFYSGVQLDQLQNETGDEAYSEIGRFIQLLSKANPTMIELLNTDKDFVLKKHPLFDEIKKEWYLSKECKNTFAGYAIAQIRKARGLNKKIVNPMEKERKTVLDFCFVPFDQGSIPLVDFLKEKGMKQEECGLAKVPHMHDMYGVYHGGDYRGIVSTNKANDVSLSSIDKRERVITLMAFNKTGHSSYCKRYREYWEWVEQRNEQRYNANVEHGKNYDTKNMMHTFRLLSMAKEITESGEVNVFRSDREFLLSVRSGKFEYDDLLKMAEDKVAELNELFLISSLPKRCDTEKLNDVLVEIREGFYN